MILCIKETSNMENADDDYNVCTSDDYSSDEDGSHRFQDNSHRRDLLAMLDNQRKTGEFTDVVVKVAGMEFPCHRAVLACSPFFRTMMSSKFAESSSKVVQLREIDRVIFSKILDFVYTGKIQIGKDDFQDILQAAHMLQIDKVPRYCLKFLKENLCPSNCLGFIRLADTYDFSDLKKKGRDVAVSQFLEVWQNEEFLTLPTDELVNLLADKDLQINSEDDVVNSVIRWLDHDAEGRKTSIPRVMQEIRLPYVRVSALEKMESHPAVRESPECLAKITAAKEEHFSGALSEDTSANADGDGQVKRSRISDELAIIVGGWRAEKLERYPGENRRIPFPLKPSQNITCLDQDLQQCYHVSDLPTTVSSHGYMSVTIAGRCLYVTGGRAYPLVGQGPHSAPSRQAFRYDFLTDTWAQFPDMPRGRAEHCSVIADEKLFLIGGDVEQGEGKSMLDIDCYDLEQGVWMNLPKMPSEDEAWNFKVTTRSYEDDQCPSWTFTVKALQGKVVVIEVLSGVVSDFAEEDEDEEGEEEGEEGDEEDEREEEEEGEEEEEDSFIEIPRVHVFDVKAACWTSTTLADKQLPGGLKHVEENIDILSIVVDDKLYFRVRHGVYRRHYGFTQTKLYAYDVKENALITEVNDEVVFTENFFFTNCIGSHNYVGGQKGIMDTMNMIDYKKYEDGESRNVATRLPFVLFGHSYIGSKKTSVGWYCRDLAKLKLESIIDVIKERMEARKARLKKWITPVLLREDGRLELFSPLGNPAHPGKENVNGTLVPMDEVITTDGVKRNVITVNGMFPGPTIEVVEGAQVVVTITNKLLSEATSIHWHGMHMRGMPYMDGVSYVTQCPIMPRESFVYRFRAEPAGTHFYHSHHSTQREDGLFGALIVHKEKYSVMPSVPVILHDWYHVESTAYWISNVFRLENGGDGEYELGAYQRSFSHDGVKLSSRAFNSALINGRGRYGNNKAPLSTFSVSPGGDVGFRIIHVGPDYPFRFSVDQHELTVTASDGFDMIPRIVHSVIIYPGESYDVTINGTLPPDLYWIRAETPRAGHCTKCYPYDEVKVVPDDVIQEVRAILAYQGVTADRDPTTTKRNCSEEKPCYVFNCPFAGYPENTNTRCISVADSQVYSSEDAEESKFTVKDDEESHNVKDLGVREIFLNFNFIIGSSVNGRRFVGPTAPLHQNNTEATVPCDEEQCLQNGCRCTHIIGGIDLKRLAM
ncbi:KLHL24 [Branchiostoma lanceolatum]|uniref:KLHL24 protein n=1 Tax=Branchiostoma lanceolatum TaxID=7740 RepID=A0A8K0ABZ5_BRALA|nr:KLHL24 [Branchiostoma lanceolatum]